MEEEATELGAAVAGAKVSNDEAAEAWEESWEGTAVAQGVAATVRAPTTKVPEVVLRLACHKAKRRCNGGRLA